MERGSLGEVQDLHCCCFFSWQDSRFDISDNGTLRINNVEVYDGTVFKCVSSTPAGSIEGSARVHVLGMLGGYVLLVGSQPLG